MISFFSQWSGSNLTKYEKTVLLSFREGKCLAIVVWCSW